MGDLLEPRDRILETAKELFTLQGYETVGVNEIINKSQVAKATFYNQFKSKEALCLKWLELEMSLSEKANQSILERSNHAEERVTLKYSALESHLLQNQFRGCPFSNTRAMTPNSEPIAECVSRYKLTSIRFWERVAKDAGKGIEVGSILFLLYAGATAESQNANNINFLKIALKSSLGLIR